MNKVDYKISAGGWSIDSTGDRRTELTELDVLHEMNGPGGHCRVSVYAREGGQAGGVAQPAGAAAGAVGGALAGAAGLGGGAAAAPSAKVRGLEVKAADALTVELTAGSLTGTVATTKVQSIQSVLERVTLVGRTGMQRLAETRVNQVYENQSLGQIVADLAGQAGVDTGDIDQGSRYPYLVVHESRSVLRTVLALARREGADVYFDHENRLTVKRFTKTASDHVLRYGVEVLELEVRTAEPVATHALVYGESPSSSTGSDTWHQLVSDLSSYRGEDGSGVRLRTRQDGAVRTKAAADAAAKARMAAIGERALAVRVGVLGRPTLRLGDGVELKDAPGLSTAGVLKVQSLRHVFSNNEGFKTFIDLSAQAPGGGAAGALGAAAGALGGLF